jgi:hypothetical protein
VLRQKLLHDDGDCRVYFNNALDIALAECTGFDLR